MVCGLASAEQALICSIFKTVSVCACKCINTLVLAPFPGKQEANIVLSNDLGGILRMLGGILSYIVGRTTTLAQ